MRKTSIVVLSLLGGLALAHGQSRADALVNGNFEVTTSGSGQIGYSTNATGWSTDGYYFIFGPGVADSTGIDSSYGNVELWGTSNGGTGTVSPSPDGGNYVAADAAFGFGSLSQLVTGLTPGQQYDVGFWWAGAQQYGYDGIGTEAWLVSLGDDTLTTGSITNTEHGFTGWDYADLRFTAGSSSETLSFMASGGPNGAPPFALLDGVTLTAVPEPASLGAMAPGLAFLGICAIRRKSSRRQASAPHRV